jgi:hypothetical protein
VGAGGGRRALAPLILRIAGQGRCGGSPTIVPTLVELLTVGVIFGTF